MNALELKLAICERIEEFCEHLFPNGKRVGHEFKVGGLDGAPGTSLSIALSGARKGCWCDFALASNGSGPKGDIFALVGAAKGLSFIKTQCYIREWLGESEPGTSQYQPQTSAKGNYSRPKSYEGIQKVTQGSFVYDYLTTSRGILPETLVAFRIAEQRREEDPSQIVFPYIRNGEILLLKWQNVERSSGGKKIIKTTKDSEPCLFGWQALSDSARDVVICEGEIDAMTWHQMGIPALSIPRGCQDLSWVETEYPSLERFETIYLAYDSDEPGIEGAKKASERLGERCRIIQPMSPELFGKDANEWLLRGATKEQFQACLDFASASDPECLKTPLDHADKIIKWYLSPEMQLTGFSTPFDTGKDEIRFRPAEVTVWTGYSHHGKTEMLNYIMLASAALGNRACIASLELPAWVTGRRLMRQAAGKGEFQDEREMRDTLSWLGDNVFIVDREGKHLDIDAILDIFKYSHRRYGVKHFALDNLSMLAVSEESLDQQVKLIVKLVDWAQKTNSHLHVVAHPRKGGGGDGKGFKNAEYNPPRKNDIRGSGQYGNLVHNVVVQWRNLEKQDKLRELNQSGAPLQQIIDYRQEEHDAIFLVDKQRETGDTPSVRLWFHKNSLQYHNEYRKHGICYLPIQSMQTEEIEDIGF